MVASAKRLAVMVIAAVLLGFSAPVAHADTDGQQRLVERARLALDAFIDDPNFEDMRVYVQNAYAVLIVPDLLKGGFFIGAEHGMGVLLVRDPQTGAWGQPAFYELYGGSLGLQFGGQNSDVLFTVMNEPAVRKLLSSRVQLGAEAGLAVGRAGAGVGAATTTRLGEDVYVFAKSKGLFGGFAIDGTYLVPKHDWNRAYYGREVDPKEIVRSQQVAHAGVGALHQSLARF